MTERHLIAILLVCTCHASGPPRRSGHASNARNLAVATPPRPDARSDTRPDESPAAQERAPGNEGPKVKSLINDGDGVFFVGNSFFGWQNRSLGQWVAALDQAMTPPIRVQVGSDIVFGNQPLASFMKHRATQDALASRKYKVFVLQGEDTEPVVNKAAFHQAVRDFNRAIVAAGGHTVLFMTWEFPWRHFIDQLSASYDEIASELGIPVIPAGLVYKDCEASPTAETPFWLTADVEHPRGDLHQNEKGSAVDAYATFGLLTGINPKGRNFRASGNTNSDGVMRYLSDRAWARVEPRLRTGPRF